MAASARLLLLGLLALLTACASTPPDELPPAQSAPGPSAAAEDVLFRAIGLVGTPYRYGGNTPESGFDCSGLIGYVYRDAAGILLPRSTAELLALRAPSVAANALMPGDLLFFSTNGSGKVSHAGIYVGERRFVHAPRAGGTVRLEALDLGYWQKSYLAAKRVLAADRLAGR
jgi:cell wall-associated NlpC family hydrolase